MRINKDIGKGTSDKISPEIQTIKDENVIFSFKYLDVSNSKFKFDDKQASYYTKIIMRIKDISSWKARDLKTSRSQSLRCHPIKWQEHNVSESCFGIPNEDEVASEPMQFNIGEKEGGRIHGFFIYNVFFVRWLDPEHNLYNGNPN